MKKTLFFAITLTMILLVSSLYLLPSHTKTLAITDLHLEQIDNGNLIVLATVEGPKDTILSTYLNGENIKSTNLSGDPPIINTSELVKWETYTVTVKVENKNNNTVVVKETQFSWIGGRQ